MRLLNFHGITEHFYIVDSYIYAWNIVLEKDGGDQLDWSCEKWRSITKGQGREEYSTNNKEREG
jgi:hypothetical protein